MDSITDSTPLGNRPISPQMAAKITSGTVMPSGSRMGDRFSPVVSWPGKKAEITGGNRYPAVNSADKISVTGTR